MEDVIKQAKKSSRSGRLQTNFEWILDRYNPAYFLVFFHEKAPMDAVIFEIGYICGRYGARNIGNKLRFLFQKGYNYSLITTAYITNLFSDTLRVEFDERSKYYNSSELVRNFVAI